MNLIRKGIQSILGCIGLWLACAQLGHAQVITITNPDFTTDTSGWNIAFDIGAAGTWNATTNPYGSSQDIDNFNDPAGGTVPITGAPVTTAGQFQMDAGDVTDPGAPYPATVTANFQNATNNTARLVSSNGGLGSFWQNTGVVFAPNTTYTFSAYTAGNSSTAAYTGVGLSGATPLTLSQVALNTDGFSTSTPQYSSLVSMELDTDGTTFQQETVTIDTATDTGLVGQDIVVNLLANNATYFGRVEYFTDASLTFTADAAPEPSTWVMMLGGLGLLAFFQRRARRHCPVAK